MFQLKTPKKQGFVHCNPSLRVSYLLVVVQISVPLDMSDQYQMWQLIDVRVHDVWLYDA
jgi:hypothetical protein